MMSSRWERNGTAAGRPRTRTSPVSLNGVRSWNQVRGKAPTAPLCLEKEHRAILTTITQTTIDARSFRASYKPVAFNLDACKTTIVDVLKAADIDQTKVPDCKGFGAMLRSLSADAAIKRRQAYEDLERVCERAGVFDELLEVTRARLHDSTQNHLFKYCISFAEEMSAEHHLLAIEQYDDKIREMESEIEKLMRQLDDSIAVYSKFKPLSVEQHLESETEVNGAMDRICSCVTNICTVIKKWLVEDKGYATKLWDEIIVKNLGRGKLMESAKKLERKWVAVAHNRGKRRLARDKTNQKLDEIRFEWKKVRNSKETVVKRLETQENELATKKKDLEDNEYKIQNRRLNSPCFLDSLWLRSETLKADIEKEQKSAAANRKHLARLQREEQNLKQQRDSTEKTFLLQVSQVNGLEQQLRAVEVQKYQSDKEVKVNGETLATLKRVREMKLSGTSLRKIFFQKMDSTSQDDLTAACRLVARRLGPDCSSLYLALPFVPSRDRDRRQRDLASVDRHASQRDHLPPQQALDCLIRWRLLHHRGNVTQLVCSLKGIAMQTLARRVEGLYLTQRTR